ncbi:unnamed protein product [Lupinus luteus]|uniref:Uncharacterized protein n=1 Tax=Lupinus luteus TaxID=3873 RepID=A0AAV1YP93_LUPLU
MVGKTVESVDPELVVGILKAEGFVTVVAHPLGGDSVLISPDEGEDLKAFLIDAKQWISTIFSIIDQTVVVRVDGKDFSVLVREVVSREVVPVEHSCYRLPPVVNQKERKGGEFRLSNVVSKGGLKAVSEEGDDGSLERKDGEEGDDINSINGGVSPRDVSLEMEREECEDFNVEGGECKDNSTTLMNGDGMNLIALDSVGMEVIVCNDMVPLIEGGPHLPSLYNGCLDVVGVVPQTLKIIPPSHVNFDSARIKEDFVGKSPCDEPVVGSDLLEVDPTNCSLGYCHMQLPYTVDAGAGVNSSQTIPGGVQSEAGMCVQPSTGDQVIFSQEQNLFINSEPVPLGSFNSCLAEPSLLKNNRKQKMSKRAKQKQTIVEWKNLCVDLGDVPLIPYSELVTSQGVLPVEFAQTGFDPILISTWTASNVHDVGSARDESLV